MNMWFVLSPNMLKVIASCAGNIYFVDPSRCAVKMNGVVIHILRGGDEWYVSSPSQRFYDLVGRYGKSTKRGSLVYLTGLQMFGVITYLAKIREEEK